MYRKQTTKGRKKDEDHFDERGNDRCCNLFDDIKTTARVHSPTRIQQQQQRQQKKTFLIRGWVTRINLRRRRFFM